MRAAVGSLEIEYETLGDPSASPMLLVMGLGAQLVRWPDALCRALADGGHFVIRFDNRDIGLSSKLGHHGRVRLLPAVVRRRLGLPVAAPYTLDDMAADAVGLLDALGIRRAHVVGASMGGMIAQIVAARHADRVASLVCAMTSSGARALPGPRLGLQLRMLRGFPRHGREAQIRAKAEIYARIGSPGFPVPRDELDAKVAREHDRSHYPQGYARQLLAILASGDRTAILRDVRARTLVIHGREDPLIPVAAAHDLHARIAGAKLEVIEGMGHDLPPALVPRIARAILAHASGA
jgi:pimeloyl-ACP methyl ester carboxylesterase